MHRTTIMLPRTLKAQAEQRAKSLGISLGQYIREAVERSMSGGGRADDPLLHPSIFDLPVIDDDGPTDMAQRHDDYLYGEREA